MKNKFSAPIPGQSLTSAPRDFPWERPPELVEVADVIETYITKLADEDNMDDLAASFEMGADIDTVVNGMIKMGAMSGLHTVESGILAGPSIAAFIKAAMATYGIDAAETKIDPDAAKAARAENRMRNLIKSKMDLPTAEEMEVSEEAPEAAEPEQLDMLAEEAPIEVSIGLMARE